VGKTFINRVWFSDFAFGFRSKKRISLLLGILLSKVFVEVLIPDP
jgi:hypothetical protein